MRLINMNPQAFLLTTTFRTYASDRTFEDSSPDLRSACIESPSDWIENDPFKYCFYAVLVERKIPFEMLGYLVEYGKEVVDKSGFLVAVASQGEDFYQVPLVYIGPGDNVVLGSSYANFKHLGLGSFSEFFPDFSKCI